MKPKKKGKICFVIYIAGERNFFFIYEVFVKQKKRKRSATHYSYELFNTRTFDECGQVKVTMQSFHSRLAHHSFQYFKACMNACMCMCGCVCACLRARP